MAIGGVVLNFAAKTAEAVRDVDKLTRSLMDTDDKTGKLSKSLKGGLAAGAAAVGAAVVAAGTALVTFAQAAQDDAAAAENLARTLRTLPGVTQKAIDANAEWIDTMQLATLIADDDLRKAVGALALATGDLTQSQKLTAIAADAAAGSGKNFDTIVTALAKAVDGNTSALKRQFPWLDKNKDGTVTLDEALGGLEGAYKGAAEAAGDKKAWDRFLITMNELKETIGAKLNPQLEKFSEWLKDKKNQDKLQEIADDTGDVIAAIAGLVRIVWALVNALKAAWDWLDATTKKIDRFYDAVNGSVTWPWESGGKWPWERSTGNAVRSAGASPMMARTSGSVAAPVTSAAPTIVVTEEQVYRAVARLMLRGEARNGRIVMAG